MPCRLLFILKLLLLLPLVLLLSPALTYGAEDEVTPIVSMKEEYNDNIFFSEDDSDIENEEADFITTLSAGLRLRRRSEQSEVLLNGRFDHLTYGKNDALNDHENYLNGKATVAVSSVFRLLADAEYRRQTRRDRELDEAGLLVDTNDPSYRQHYGIGGEYTLTEDTQMALNYSFDRYDYDDPDSYDTKYQGVDFGIYHSLTTRTVGRCNLGFMSYDMSNSIDTLLPGIIPDPEIPVFTLTEGVARDKRTVDNYSFTLGASHALSELFTILVDVGARYTASDGKLRYITPPPVQSLNPDVKSDDDGLGSIGQITVSYADEKNTVSFVAYRDITAVGGSYGTTERTSFAISGGRRITDELSCNFSVTYYWNQSEAGELSRQEVDEETYVITPSLRYTLTDTIDLETQWQYVNNEDQEDDSEADRSLVFLRLVYEFPLID